MKKLIVCFCVVSFMFVSCKSSKDCGCPYPVSSSADIVEDAGMATTSA